MHETLLKQAGAIEEKLGILAQEFNEVAEKLQSITPKSEESPVVDAADQSDASKAKPRRRGGMFGSELTLDD